MNNERGIAASFAYMDDLLRAVERLKQAGFGDFQVFSPAPRHEIEHLVQPGKSPVRFVTFSGAFFGLCFGFLLAIGTSLVWNLVTGGKPVVSLPAFLVVAFEMTILFGALANLGAVFLFAWLPDRISPAYDPSFSDDRFGLYVRAPGDREKDLLPLLGECGPEKFWRVEGREKREIAAEGGRP